MTSDNLRDYFSEAVLDGPSVVAFDDDESDENDNPDTSVGYGSLLSLGAGIRKKQPLIMVDPVEAENEARRVQHIAAQQLAGHDEAGAIDFLEGLADLIEPEISEGDETRPEADSVESHVAAEEVSEDLASDEAGLDQAMGDGDGESDVLRLVEVAAETEQVPDEIPETVEVPACDAANETGALDPVAAVTPPEAQDCPLAPAQPAAPRQGHSLRARVPAGPSRKTLADRLAAFTGWLYEWLTKERG